MGIVAVLNTVGLIALGIDYAWFFGSFASLLMPLPYIGIAIGSISPVLFALAVKDSAWFQVVQFLEGNIITSNIVCSKASINPLMAIIGILLGGMIFGLDGLIIALPLIATLNVIFDANPNLEAIPFLIGEPEKVHLKRNSTQELLIKWGIVKISKTNKNIKMDVDLHVDNRTEKAPNTAITDTEINDPEELPDTDRSRNENKIKIIRSKK